MHGHIRWIIALIALGAQLTPQAFAQHAHHDLRVDADRIERRIQALAAFGRNPDGGNSRVAFSEADVQGRDYIISQDMTRCVLLSLGSCRLPAHRPTIGTCPT